MRRGGEVGPLAGAATGGDEVLPLPRSTLRLFRPRAVRRHLEGQDPFGRLLDPPPRWLGRGFWLVVALAAAAAAAAALWPG